MNNEKYLELLKKKDDLIVKMADYIKYNEMDDEFDSDLYIDSRYNQDDVDKCNYIMTDFLRKLNVICGEGKNEYILFVIKDAVVALNELNRECEEGLIETSEREGICEIMIEAALDAGLIAKEYDVTEKWRDW